MAAPWMKFYPSDWRADPALRMCSISARGLWMEMLCVMHEAVPRGSLLVNGLPVSDRQLSGLAGLSVRETALLISELESAGVFSRENNGVVYSRRMRRDEEKSARDKANGKGGGNPKLKGQDKPGVGKGVNPPDKAQKPEARSQKEEHAARPDAAPGNPPSRWDHLEQRLCDAASPMPIATNPDVAPISQMLANGFDLELDVLPAIDAAKREGKSFRRWDQLVGWVETQNKGRLKSEGAKPVTAPAETFLEKTHRVWRQQLTGWKQYGKWSDQWGAHPDSPSCAIPRAFVDAWLAEHPESHAA